MALASNPFVPTSAAPATNAGVNPAIPIPDNCHTVVVLNPSAADSVLVGEAAAGTLLVAGTNAMSIPPGASLSLAIGTLSQRGPMDPVVAPGKGLIYGTTGAALTAQVLYLNAFGVI